jgi:uncharacterized repeat protein (TIGR04138 family)
MIDQTVIDTIRDRIVLSGRDERYKLGAYAFVLRGLDYYRLETGDRRHFTGDELSHALVRFAINQFGPLAFNVLRHWGIMTPRDFGYIVYNLIDIQLIRKQPTDSLEDFFVDIDIEEVLTRKEYYTVEKEYIRSV